MRPVAKHWPIEPSLLSISAAFHAFGKSPPLVLVGHLIGQRGGRLPLPVLEPRHDRCRHQGATPVLHFAHMPTKHPRHAVTETPPVKAALDELRAELGDSRIEFGELVILGARQKVAQLRTDQDDSARRRRALAERIRRRDIPVDREAADEVRRAGWTRR